MAGMKADKMKPVVSPIITTASAMKSERLPTISRFRQMNTKVSPLPFPPTEETLELSIQKPITSFSSHQRAKQVSDPIGESVKAKICDSHIVFGHQRIGSTGSSSSGSEHEPKSVCLAEMVNEFMEDEADRNCCGRARCNCDNGTCNGYGCHGSDEEDMCNSTEVLKTLQDLSRPTNNMERKLLADVVLTANEAWSDSENVCSTESVDCTRGCLRRAVMSRLRALGYNAAVCKSRWDHSRGFPGGDYEYLDVTLDGTLNAKDRFLVDIDFRGQFQIARPTQQFTVTLQAIPTIYVGRADRLQKIVEIMTDATRKSLKRRTMHLPPWRKAEYMRAKWMSPYKRTTNDVPLSGPLNGCVIQSTFARGLAGGINNTKVVSEEDAFRYLPDLTNGDKVDAVIYKGKVFSTANQMERPNEASRPLTENYGGNMKGSRANIVLPLPRQECKAGCRDIVKENSVMVSAQDTKPVNGDWQPPVVKPRTSIRAGQVKAGLAMVLKESGISRQTKKAVKDEPLMRMAMMSAS